MDKEWTGSFQPSLSAASISAEAALFQFRSNILLCQPTGMSWRKTMLTRSLYFWCQTGVGFGGWLENRKRSQGAQEAQATKANGKALLLWAHSLRSAFKWTGLGSCSCLSYYTIQAPTQLRVDYTMPAMLVEPVIKAQPWKIFCDADQ